MNKKIWIISPVFYGVSVAMLAMACLSLPFNLMLFALDMLVAVISVVLIYFGTKNFNGYINDLIKNAADALGDVDVDFLQRIPIPTVLVGKIGEIVSYNMLFRDVVGKGRGWLGESISQFLTGETLGGVLAKNGVDIKYNGRNYIVYGSQFESAAALYFIECTEYREIEHEYRESRPVVALILFDNKEEFKRDCTDAQLSQISSAVETILREWAAETSGFIKKLNDAKFIMIFENRHLKIFKSDKFKIISRIHNIKLDDHRFATVSIGIGCGASDMLEAERWAQNALDMSLGRGGDQVSIKKGETYEFFGGNSKEVEKRSKVRTRVIASALYEQMSTSDLILISGHKFSDLDSIGAAIGIWSVASNIKNKKAYIVVDRDTTLAGNAIEKLEGTLGETVFISPEKSKSILEDNSLLVVVDTHCASFLEDSELYKKCKNVVVIDHHRMVVDHISDAVIFYHETFASSASEMVTELVQYMGDKNLKKAEAECLLAGIMLDTKNFFMKTGIRTFEAAAYLRKKGADTIEVKKMFFDSIDTYKIKCKIIDNAEIYNDCAIAAVTEAEKDLRIACAQAADDLLGIRGIKASFVIFPYKDQICVSARALGEINVQVVMEKLGGGGHQGMAATQISDTSVDEVKVKLSEILENLLNTDKDKTEKSDLKWGK